MPLQTRDHSLLIHVRDARATWAAALFAITILAYIPVFHAGYIWDDDSYILNNYALRTLNGLWAIWTNPSATPQYYPLVHTTFWIEYHLWGIGSAAHFHIINVLLHAASAVLLWRILLSLQVPGSWFAAALFAVHPVNVESVAWVTERKNVLSTLFYLLSLRQLLRAYGVSESPPTTKQPFDRRAYSLAIVFFICALLSKTVTATLPAAFLVILWWKRGRLCWRDVWPLLPLFVAGLVAGSFTGYLERTLVGAHGPEFASITPIDRVLIAGRAIAFYAGKWVWPAHLTFIYPRWTVTTKQLWQFAFPVDDAAVVVLLWAMRRRIGRGALAGVLLYIGALTPALGFVNVFPMRYSFVADHFQYLATLPAAAVTAALLWWAIRWPLSQKVICTAIIALLMILTFRQSLMYKNSLTLWRNTLSKNPNSWMVHTNLGHALMADHQPNAAAAQYRMSLKLAPQLPATHQDVGSTLASHHHLKAAAKQFRRAMQIDPTYAPAYWSLAHVYLDMGNLKDAQMWAHRAVNVAGGMQQPYTVLAQTLQAEGKPKQALEQYQMAARAGPYDARTHENLANALLAAGQKAEALREYSATVAIDPSSVHAWAMLSKVYGDMGDADRALQCYRMAQVAAAARDGH